MSSSSVLPVFDIDQIPFSRRGSWLSLSRVTGLHLRKDDIHLVSHQTRMTGVLTLRPVDLAHEPLPVEVEADPSQLTWTSGDGSVRAVFETVDTVRLRGEGVSFEIADAADELTPFTGTWMYVDPIDDSVVLTSYETGRRYRITTLAGDREVEGAELLGAGVRRVTFSGAWEAVIEEYETGRLPYRGSDDLETVRRGTESEFGAYLDAVAPWRSDATPAAALAVYVVWSASVAPSGFLGRESVLMSKHWMDKVWSWDHCFNAFALADGLPDLAMDQFLTPFDHQESSGALPDSVTHSERLYNFVKPPMHGWALRKLRARLSRPLSRDELSHIHAKLSRWADFWLDFRRAPGHELPNYQHGNDSGWDNSTMFDHDRLVDAPDLAAFLALLLDELASLGEEIGIDGADRREQARRVRAALVAELWTPDGFIAVGTSSGTRSKTASLLTLLPIVDAEALDSDVVDVISARVDEILTEWGPATEPVDSPDYESDGYWRGPIWAPSTVIVEDGLRRAGRAELADRVSERFRRLCEKSGFAENFDAVTGEGLRDRAYTWTASAYLLLAAESVGR